MMFLALFSVLSVNEPALCLFERVVPAPRGVCPLPRGDALDLCAPETSAVVEMREHALLATPVPAHSGIWVLPSQVTLDRPVWDPEDVDPRIFGEEVRERARRWRGG
jgi:hypothetical protein